MTISVIIPTYNEESNISRLIKHLLACKHAQVKEVLVVDGGSTDNTVAAAQCAKVGDPAGSSREQPGVEVLVSPQKGRSFQMNLGAQRAKGDILYFVHADALPPATYAQDILDAHCAGHEIGCFRTRFDSGKLLLRINGYCSRFDRIACRGGDQTLFVTKSLFDSLGGYDNYYVVMEDYDFILRAQQKAAFKIIPKEVQVSARKYDKNNYFRVNLANLIVFTMFRMGYAPVKLRDTYQKLIDYPIA